MVPVDIADPVMYAAGYQDALNHRTMDTDRKHSSDYRKGYFDGVSITEDYSPHGDEVPYRDA